MATDVILDGLEQAAEGRPVREVIRGREIDWRLMAKILTDEWMSGQLLHSLAGELRIE